MRVEARRTLSLSELSDIEYQFELLSCVAAEGTTANVLRISFSGSCNYNRSATHAHETFLAAVLALSREAWKADAYVLDLCALDIESWGEQTLARLMALLDPAPCVVLATGNARGQLAWSWDQNELDSNRVIFESEAAALAALLEGRD